MLMDQIETAPNPIPLSEPIVPLPEGAEVAYQNFPKKKHRRSFTAQEKLAVIAEVEEFGFNVTQRKYKLQGTQITKWRRNAEYLRHLTEKGSSACRVMSTDCKFPEVENFVYNQYLHHPNKVSNNQLQDWAKQAAALPEVLERYGNEILNAKFGASWLTKFKREYNITTAHTSAAATAAMKAAQLAAVQASQDSSLGLVYSSLPSPETQLAGLMPERLPGNGLEGVVSDEAAAAAVAGLSNVSNNHDLVPPVIPKEEDEEEEENDSAALQAQSLTSQSLTSSQIQQHLQQLSHNHSLALSGLMPHLSHSLPQHLLSNVPPPLSHQHLMAMGLSVGGLGGLGLPSPALYQSSLLSPSLPPPPPSGSSMDQKDPQSESGSKRKVEE